MVNYFGWPEIQSAPFGMALSGVKYLFDTSAFAQIFNPDVIINGNFAAWTADNPDSWTVTGESGADPEVTQRAANAGHAGAGTGACNFFSSATNNQPRINQTVLVTGTVYESVINVTNRVAGNLAFGSGLSPISNNYSTTGIRRTIARATGTTLQLTGGTAATDVTLDDVSEKPLTLDSYVELSAAQGTYEFWFTLPSAPVAGEEIHMLYHVQDSDDAFFDCWDALVRRDATNSAWDFRLESYSAGTRTNRINVTGIGNVDGIKIVNPTGLHTAYTKLGADYTQRGSQVANSLHQAETGFQVVYNSTMTPIRRFAIEAVA